MEDHCSGRDEASNCQYNVRVKSTLDEYRHDAAAAAAIHEVRIDVRCEFVVPSEVAHNFKILSCGDRLWCFDADDFLNELDGIRDEVVELLDLGRVPLVPRNETMRMIFEGVLGDNYPIMSRVKEEIRLFVCIKTVVDGEEEESLESEEEEMSEDEDEDGGDAEFDYMRRTPAGREAVEALEKVRIRGGERETSCSICLEEFSLESTEATKMPCSHVFHQDCLVRWLEYQCFCPLCKFELSTAEEEDAEVAVMVLQSLMEED